MKGVFMAIVKNYDSNESISVWNMAIVLWCINFNAEIIFSYVNPAQTSWWEVLLKWDLYEVLNVSPPS